VITAAEGGSAALSQRTQQPAEAIRSTLSASNLRKLAESSGQAETSGGADLAAPCEGGSAALTLRAQQPAEADRPTATTPASDQRKLTQPVGVGRGGSNTIPGCLLNLPSSGMSRPPPLLDSSGPSKAERTPRLCGTVSSRTLSGLLWLLPKKRRATAHTSLHAPDTAGAWPTSPVRPRAGPEGAHLYLHLRKPRQFSPRLGLRAPNGHLGSHAITGVIDAHATSPSLKS